MATFKEAFAAARKSGKKEFSWQSKKYNTKLKEETSSAPASSKKPQTRPAAKAASAPASAKDAKADRATPAKPGKAPSFMAGLTMSSADRTKATLARERERKLAKANARISGSK